MVPFSVHLKSLLGSFYGVPLAGRSDDLLAQVEKFQQDHKKVVKKAWEMCRVGVHDANLSYESLTSPTARQMLRDLPITDPDFFAELTRVRNSPPVLTDEEAQLEDVEVSELDVPSDDSAVPLEAVEDALHGALPMDDIEQEFIVGEYGLVSAAEAEETLVESVNDVVLDTTSIVDQGLGRGRRKKFRNMLYLASNYEFTHDSKAV
ncbi:hypothetical protein BJ912DRAFT_243071 [Pholiota molesta]|nr:hypothetical protein BJ912DRAFT_243071 [Pholiota molesta]